jgi:uncharacterized ParB-like nuclease family protein
LSCYDTARASQGRPLSQLPAFSQLSMKVRSDRPIIDNIVDAGNWRIEELDIDQIVIPQGGRSVDPKVLDRMVESMRAVGLLSPIIVLENDDGSFELIVGRHRIAAARALGWSKIACRIERMDPLTREICEIDENYCRKDWNKLERAERLARRKVLYELKYPEKRPVNQRGGPGRGKKTSAELAPVSLPIPATGSGFQS